MPFPKISIVFCVKCKWNLRSAWYLQELLQTFGDELKEVSLVPGQVGTFKILGYKNDDNQGSEILLWDRSVDGGFPDSKYLKQRVKASFTVRGQYYSRSSYQPKGLGWA